MSIPHFCWFGVREQVHVINVRDDSSTVGILVCHSHRFYTAITCGVWMYQLSYFSLLPGVDSGLCGGLYSAKKVSSGTGIGYFIEVRR